MEKRSPKDRLLIAGKNLYKIFKGFSIGVCGIFFCFTGAAHFHATSEFAAIVPDVLPNPEFWVQLSGVFEILGGLGLMIPKTRKYASWGLMALLVAVFPANINMAVNSIDFGLPHEWLWWRLPLQLPLILWVYWCGREPKRETKSDE